MNGIISLDTDDDGTVRARLHSERVLLYKAAKWTRRRRIPARTRARLLTEEGYRCARCGRRFDPDELQIDHVVPLKLYGADEPGNWVALCSAHNRDKWQYFRRHYLRYYRRRPIRGSVGVRFKNGFFWPHINGRTRTKMRDDW
jgi:5-methylcytosine-specific restriction endonuclease McrA